MACPNDVDPLTAGLVWTQRVGLSDPNRVESGILGDLIVCRGHWLSVFPFFV